MPAISGAPFPKRVVGLLIGILLIANIINIGADLSAMAASAQLVAGGGEHLFVIGFAVLCVILQLFIPYRQYANVLKWLTLSLFAYVGVVLLVHIDWPAALLGMVWPTDLGSAAMLTIVAVFGTTISPYLFFWQSSQEAEESRGFAARQALKQAPRTAPRELRRIRADTLLGMAFSNLIALAIMLATAATLHTQGITQIESRRAGGRGAAPDRRPVRLRSVRDRDHRHRPPRRAGAGRFGGLRGLRGFRVEGRARIPAAARPRASIRSSSLRLSWASSSTGRTLDPIKAPCSGARC